MLRRQRQLAEAEYPDKSDSGSEPNSSDSEGTFHIIEDPKFNKIPTKAFLD